MERSSRHLATILALNAVSILALLLFVPPIAQPPQYHQFADAGPAGMPALYNVVSNLPFLVVSIYGLWRLRTRTMPNHRAFAIFFLGLGLVAFGSSYFHLDPNIDRLLWDRLPMSIAFMALFHAALCEHLPMPRLRRWLWPLVAVGAASVVYWYVSERLGQGDLRWYLLVQFVPVVVISYLIVACPTGNRSLWLGVIGWYALAKGFELADQQVHDVTGLIGGHPFKHLFAAAAGYWVIRIAVRSRWQRADQSPILRRASQSKGELT